MFFFWFLLFYICARLACFVLTFGTNDRHISTCTLETFDEGIGVVFTLDVPFPDSTEEKAEFIQNFQKKLATRYDWSADKIRVFLTRGSIKVDVVFLHDNTKVFISLCSKTQA